MEIRGKWGEEMGRGAGVVVGGVWCGEISSVFVCMCVSGGKVLMFHLPHVLPPSVPL